MGDQEWHEHVKAAADRALWRVRGDLSANPPYDNDVPYWPDTLIVHEGTGCWGTCRTDLFDAMKRLGWLWRGAGHGSAQPVAPVRRPGMRVGGSRIRP